MAYHIITWTRGLGHEWLDRLARHMRVHIHGQADRFNGWGLHTSNFMGVTYPNEVLTALVGILLTGMYDPLPATEKRSGTVSSAALTMDDQGAATLPAPIPNIFRKPRRLTPSPKMTSITFMSLTT